MYGDVGCVILFILNCGSRCLFIGKVIRFYLILSYFTLFRVKSVALVQKYKPINLGQVGIIYLF